MAKTGTKQIKKYNENKSTNNKLKNGELIKFGKDYCTKKVNNIIQNNTGINEYELLDNLKQKKLMTKQKAIQTLGVYYEIY